MVMGPLAKAMLPATMDEIPLPEFAWKSILSSRTPQAAPETIPFEVVLEIGQRAEVCSTGNGGYEMMKRCWPTAE